jgi:ATP-binding cassette subfamily F protein uup
MPLLSFAHLSVSFGLEPLLEDAAFQIDRGERVCLIGRNGAGKSTLLKIAEGELVPDQGEVWRQPGLRIARLTQEVPFEATATAREVVASGLAELAALLADYQQLAEKLPASPAQLRRLENLEQQLETRGAWRLGQRVDQLLARLQLPGDAPLGTLSGGLRRRVALARALVCEPDLLLLDEPTNHLDIEIIQWLEEQLLEFRGGVLFVTHDRALLGRLATRIVELDRGALRSWPGSYQRFLADKAAALEEEARQNALFDKKLAQEEAWIRQGIKARRTRNEGRVRALEALRAQRARRREVEGAVRMALDEGQGSGQLVVELQGVSYAWEGAAPLLRELSLRIMRGDRIGLVGPNGVGKTTLLQLLLGQLAPSAGSVRLGTKLEIAYYDQLRAVLDPEKSVAENVAPDREFIEIGGQRRHIIGYLQDFLFAPERARAAVKMLSGGERNRLLLARLFAQPANLLVLDEPTNDLDLETLELLEALLADYTGTLLLVSHDRAFLDQVVTSTLVFEGEGHVQEYVGGFSDWLRQRKLAEPASAKSAASRAAPAPRPGKRPPAKLSFKDERELAELPAAIEALETEHAGLLEQLGRPDFYRVDPLERARIQQRLAGLPPQIDAAYARWAELEARRGGQQAS